MNYNTTRGREVELKGRFDFILFSIVLILAGISVLLLYSISSGQPEGYWSKQIIWYGAGLVGMVAVTIVPRQFWYHVSPFLYGITLVPLLLATGSAKGAERWFNLGGFSFQPSEFAKIGLLLFLARLFASRQVGWNNLRSAIVPAVVWVVPFLLILKQPNLSTALATGMIFFVMLFWSGFRFFDMLLFLSPIASVILSFQQTIWAIFTLVSWFVLGLLVRMRELPARIAVFFGLVLLMSGLASQVVWNSVLKPHQQSRILTFINPMRDPGGAGYQVIQSQVTIGSGGLAGKGFGQGSQTKLKYLPEEHTDFIFAVLAEQFGFIGCVTVIVLFFLFLFRALQLCFDYSDRFSNLVTVGAVTVFAFHISVNISMTLGLMPVTGLPLPFLSYGGSFVITSMILVGFLLHIRMGDEE